MCREHGALDYKERADDEMNVNFGVAFPRQLKLKPVEAPLYTNAMPFDDKRIVYGGSTVFVDPQSAGPTRRRLPAEARCPVIERRPLRPPASARPVRVRPTRARAA